VEYSTFLFYCEIVCIFAKNNEIMEEIKNYIETYLKETYKVYDDDIHQYVLSSYLDSLDIVDLVIEIERHYDITIDDYNDWGDMFVDDIVKYINSKINGYGEENTK
jgi:acyl carrier protein